MAREIFYVEEDGRELSIIDRNLFVEIVYYDKLTNDYIVKRETQPK